MPQRTLPQLFEDSVKRFKTSILISEKKEGRYQGLTYGEVREEVHACAAGLLAQGMDKGDRIGLLSEGRKDWLVAELGILYCGAICVPLSPKLEETAELVFRIQHSGARWLVVSRFQTPKALRIREQVPQLRVITLDEETEPGLTTLAKIRAAGRSYLEVSADRLTRRWTSIEESDPATISYTSGTTADPKGIVLTHRNYTANVEQCSAALDVRRYYRSLLILPWDHSFTHTAGLYLIIANGAEMGAVQAGRTQVETLRNIPANIREYGPTFLFSVPALAANFRKNIESGVRQKGVAATRLFHLALKMAYACQGNGFDRPLAIRLLLRPLLAVFDRLLFRKIREAFGGRLEFFISGGALLDIELQRFFYALGLPMLQGYGLTEATPVISTNVPLRHKLGTSGRPLPGVEVRICDAEGRDLKPGEAGEIVVRGENVMAGYWNNEGATRRALRDGWLWTGDLGRIDKDGFLSVLGRVKSLLIGADGEKFSPEGIEEAIVAHSPFIDQIMLYNNQSPYTTALLVPNRAALVARLAESGMAPSDDSALSHALRRLEQAIDDFRQGGQRGGEFPTKWLPATFAALEEGFTEQNGLMNATLKMVRSRIVERHRERLDYLYTAEGKRIDNPKNRSALAALLR
jgi:long-chain acyl-CoA synthetase